MLLSLGCSFSSSQSVSWHRLVDLFITEGVCCRLQSLSSVINVGFLLPPKQTQTGLLNGSPTPRDALERYTYNMLHTVFRMFLLTFCPWTDEATKVPVFITDCFTVAFLWFYPKRNSLIQVSFYSYDKWLSTVRMHLIVLTTIICRVNAQLSTTHHCVYV